MQAMSIKINVTNGLGELFFHHYKKIIPDNAGKDGTLLIAVIMQNIFRCDCMYGGQKQGGKNLLAIQVFSEPFSSIKN